jgi:hypothetical protein
LNISRQPGESIKDYTIRLCRNREQYGLKWDDVAALLNKETGEDYGESRYRKWFNAWNEGYEDGYRDALQHRVDGDPLLQEYEDRRIEVQKEIERLKDQRRIYANLIRQQARAEYIKSELIDAVHKLAEVKPIVWDYRPHPSNPKREAWQMFADLHRGLYANNYWNTFDNDEFDRRIKRVVSKSIEYSLFHDVRKVHIALAGDLCHGVLHVTNRILSTEDVITQIQMVAEYIAYALVEYANQFEEVVVHYVPGNHSRVHRDKSESLQKENFEFLIPWFLKARLQHVKNITFEDNKYDPEIVCTKVAGWDVGLVHGDKDSPSTVVQNFTLMTGVKPHYLYAGHIHKYYRDEVHGTYVIVSPSLSGADDYSISKRLTSNPAQLLTIFDEYEGELCTYPIRLDKK